MVASLQSRRKALESKIREKNDELKNLCIQEAELTGVLPPEIPLEPGESPPAFRRRMGTAFVIPENLINKLKSKEEESLANLELECKIQTSIAEAALGLANDGSVSKSVRRKHRLMYQQSQRHLHELEARLNALRQNSRSHPKQRKKPRPPLESENDCVDGNVGPNISDKNDIKNQPYHPALSYTVSDKGPIRHSFPVNNFNRISDPPPTHRHLDYNYSCTPSLQQHYTNDSREKHMKSSVGGHVSRDQGGWTGDTVNNINNYLRMRQNISNINEMDRGYQFRDRFGSLDRRRTSGGGYQHGDNNENFEHSHYSQSNHVINTLGPSSQPYQPNPPQLNSVLLPNQTYPENSLMRTQSLGSVELTKCDPDTRSLKSNSHHSSHAFESLKPDTSSRNSRLYFDNRNYLEANKYQSDTTSLSLKLEPNELYNIGHSKVFLEPEFAKTASSHENLKLEHNSYPARGHHHGHGHHNEHGKYDLRTVVEGTALNSYSQSHHDLHFDIHSLSLDPKESKKFESMKPELPAPHHEPTNHRTDLRPYPPRFPEPPRPAKYSSKPELRPSQYRDREERLTTEVVQAMCADSYHHETVVPVETVTESNPTKYDAEPTEFPEVAVRKIRDKEWYETSLDSRQAPETSQTPPLPPQFSSPPPPPLPPPPPRSVTPNLSHNHPVTTNATQQASSQPVDFDTVVPFESPKNHTVVQAGKWQPYREVTKPFEMADFYKYSTKFRNKSAIPNSTTPGTEPAQTQSHSSSSQLSPQHKGVYKPLKSMTCQLLINNSPRGSDLKLASDGDSPAALSNSSQIQSPPSLANAFSTEMLAWYQDQSSAPQTRSATLV
ncbi:uncharacterized protein sstn isoform X2 [Bemisia tabaci]|nr:PREDICTED: uncharacterized protein LOC109042720 isoform X2 [Bemisia tabaci]